jgi:predicted ATP-dependent endonuclease of OLD family
MSDGKCCSAEQRAVNRYTGLFEHKIVYKIISLLHTNLALFRCRYDSAKVARINMKIAKLEIKNYRILKNFSMDLEEDLSLIIGKNNTGKTSILSVMDKFLGVPEKSKFSIDDFNLDFKKQLFQDIQSLKTYDEAVYVSRGISLRLYIEYGPNDNLASISRVMMDLDPDNNIVVLGFDYALDFNNYNLLLKDYGEFLGNEALKQKIKKEYIPKSINDFFRNNHSNYFSVKRRSILYSVLSSTADERIYIDIDKERINLSDLINFKYISAKRDVTNRELDKTLSTQTSRIYKRTEATEEKSNAVEDFKDKLSETDTHLSGIYKVLFEKIISKIRIFGGIKINESEIEIVSTLQHRELLEGNTTVVYRHDPDSHLPEHYNGLGYMNLISMIFEIEILIHEFKRKKDKNPAAVNLLFIEEPEAHTHPQMQYVFIKNIKQLLSEGIICENGVHAKLQYVISTHSAAIVADSDFGDIKYVKRNSANSVTSRSLKDLQNDYDLTSPQYHFLTQYLTINRAEIFFADKAILIEGDTERLLLSTIMRKLDIECVPEENINALPLLSQNISIIEVGAYSQIFEKFIEFVGIKTLIITDLDSVDDNGKKCRVRDGSGYSNAAIKHFYKLPKLNDAGDRIGSDYVEPNLKDLISYDMKRKVLSKSSDHWINHSGGSLAVIYQTLDSDYIARSFEDAFIHVNRKFIDDNIDSFEGLKNKSDFKSTVDSYDLAENCIKKKTHFALDIIYHSDESFANWKIPAYIREGLLWLKAD